MIASTSAAAGTIKRRAAWIAVLCALAGTSAITAPWWPEAPLPVLQWLIGLSIHWQWLYLVVGGLAASVSVALGRRTGWLAILVLGAAWWSHAQPAAPAVAPGASAMLRIGTANIHVGNPDLSRLQQWLLASTSPDIVLLQEFDHAAARLVSHGAVLARYPHQMLAPGEDPFGMALLSRHPLTFTETVTPRDHWHTLSLRARVCQRVQ